MSSDTPTLDGVVLLSEELPTFAGASLNVRIEDVSEADAPAIVVAQQTVPSVSHQQGACDAIRFALGPLASFDREAAYVIRAHVALAGGSEIRSPQPGDFITMESYPVLTLGHPNWIAVRVREVR